MVLLRILPVMPADAAEVPWTTLMAFEMAPLIVLPSTS